MPSGAALDGSFTRPFFFSPCVSSKRRWHLMSRPPEPQQGSIRFRPAEGPGCGPSGLPLRVGCRTRLRSGPDLRQICGADIHKPEPQCDWNRHEAPSGLLEKNQGEGSVAGVVCCTSDVLIYVRWALEVFATCGLSRSKQRRQV